MISRSSLALLVSTGQLTGFEILTKTAVKLASAPSPEAVKRNEPCQLDLHTSTTLVVLPPLEDGKADRGPGAASGACVAAAAASSCYNFR